MRTTRLLPSHTRQKTYQMEVPLFLLIINDGLNVFVSAYSRKPSVTSLLENMGKGLSVPITTQLCSDTQAVDNLRTVLQEKQNVPFAVLFETPGDMVIFKWAHSPISQPSTSPDTSPKNLRRRMTRASVEDTLNLPE